MLNLLNFDAVLHSTNKKKNPFRPPETFHLAVTARLDSTEHRLFSVLQIRLVAVIERLLLIHNQCKTPAHAAACSLPSADRGGTFSLTGLTLALCGCISLWGGTNPYSCHIYSQVLAGLLFFSAAVCRNARNASSPATAFVALLLCRLVAHRESYFPDVPSHRGLHSRFFCLLWGSDLRSNEGVMGLEGQSH